ncbi:helix-turn-helix domain-containing protein [Streptomyces sp. JW3]|uniref:helix-turn-helix domain-containing protein n=1 Tax=Streptomyces sp. JW3 TaxID=3456955 RepID=UPI003FA45FF8
MEDEEAAAMLQAVGRQVKLWREAAGMTQSELGPAIGYSEEMVSSVERGRRAPKPDFLDNSDVVLNAGGKLSAMKEDVEKAHYPKKVRDLAKVEAEAVDLGAYEGLQLHGMLQTEEYARALYAMRRPALTEEEIERHVAARMARKSFLDHVPHCMFTFIQDEVTLRRPIGGKLVMRRQLEHLLDVGQMRHVTMQVAPTDQEEHAGMAGSFQVLKLRGGKTVGHSEGQLYSRLITDPREVQKLEMRYGMIRAQALTPRESLAFIKKVLGEMT